MTEDIELDLDDKVIYDLVNLYVNRNAVEIASIEQFQKTFKATKDLKEASLAFIINEMIIECLKDQIELIEK